MAEAREKQRLFVDIDGTLAVFTPVDTLETLYEQGYFLNLAPHENVVAAVKEIVANHPEIEVNILSAYLTDSQYALQEKNEWLDRYLPEIDQAHRVFVPCGSDKKEGISGGIRSDDFLLDDYTHNLNEWQPPARGIKLLNAINHTRGSWEHDRIRYDRTPTDLADGILSIMRDEKQIFDEKINESGVSQVRNALESRVTGDELLNAQDLIEELRAVGADIDENGYVTVYHRTDHASEENIKSSHVMVAKEDGLFFSTVENGQNEGYGDSVVKLSVPVEKLVLDDIFSDEAHLRYPLENGIRRLDISDYLIEEREENMAQDRQPSLNQMPVSEIATLDFVSNPDRQGTGGLNRDSRMFEAMLLHTMEQEQTELYRRYDEAFTAANLKDDFQPKIAILQLREGEENHNRRFTSLETLDRILHEQPNCENYELVYLRNAEAKAETEQERERLNNQLYAEFNADTLRPRDYYGHSLSVGDVIVMTNDFSEQHAYYVDDMGFTKLPDDFLSHEMSAKIRNDLDIRQEGALYETIGQFEAENTLSIMDKTATDRYFQITSEYSRIFELADRRGAIMDMDALGYEPAQVDGFSDDFLMWKPKNEEENTFGFDGWDAVRDFTHDVQTLMNDYTVQQLRDRANGDYSVIEYGSFGDREVETAINNHPQDEYRRQVQAIYEYEVANNIPENDRMTKWYDEMNISVAKPWYKENDPSVMDRAVGDRRIPISEAAIAARYAEISREQQERNSPFTAENEPLVDISDLEYDEDGYLHFTVTADDYGLEGLYRIYDPANGDSMTLVSIDYGYLHPIIERQWDRIENALYDITLDRYNAMDRPTLAEDITNIKGVDRQYNAGMREMTYTFECDVRGTHDILTYEVSQHDDGEGYTIHTENNDIWESMSEPELRKLEAVLSREATYFLWQQRIENAVTVDDLREVRYGFMEAENLNLSQAQRELIWDGIDAKQIEIERSAQVSVMYEPSNDSVVVSLSRMEQDGNEDVLSTGAASMTLDEFKQMSRADFERFVGEVNAYNMVEQERVPSPEREQEHTHGDNIRNPFNETNFKIQPVDNGGFVVRSDSERFGNNEIVFQGISYDECLGYIAERTDNITPHYYVIKDLASWRHDVWEQGKAPERSAVERFDTVEEAIAKFNEYKGMDYLKESVINPDNNEPMRRLALGVSYEPVQMAELDLLHTEADKTLLLSDAIGERENGYERFMTNDKFIRDLNKITSSIAIDEYSYYRDTTIEELATDRLAFLNENYPEETHTMEEAMRVAEEYVRQHPNYLRSNSVNERVAFADFTPPFLNKGENELNHGDYENITLHIRYQEPIRLNGFVAETDTITFGSQEELNKYVNGEAAYDVLDNSVMKRDNEILLYAENENGDVVWGTKEEQRETESMTYGGFDYTVIDKWQDDNASYVVGQLEADDGTWYAAKVTDTTEQYHGEYEYEFSTDKPTRNEVEDMHLNHISEIAIDRHEAEYGADGSRNFPNLNDPSPEEQAEELRQIVAEKSAPVEIDETLPPKDQLKQRLENGVRQVLDSEQFKNWLTTGGKLFYNNYSFRNAMLVWLQKPDASYVMGYEKWKDFGRNVKQGAQGAKIFIPLMASEKYKGGLFRSIKSNLTDQLSKDPSLTEASYRLGTSNLEFTMNRANHLIGFKVNGKEQQIFGSDDEAKRFIDRAIIGKVPTGFTVGTVFDAKDVIVPEYLWVKSGYTKEEIAPDEKGNPVKNRRGEVRIFNTPERQARFQTELDTRIVAKDPVKMQALFDACVAASERKGVPVSLAEKADDSTLDGGAKGYFSRQFTEDKPNGFIVIDNSLEITEKCAVLFHEMGHADLHKNLEALAKSMGEDKITREMREVQAEATAYAVASTFGIETDTSSFQYLAAYARGFELQDFQKSLDVIYRETQALTNDIKAELDIRGLNLDLTEKPKEMLNKETLETLSTKYMDFAAEQGSKVQAALNELPSLVKQSAGNPELMDVLKYQKANLDSRKADLDTMLTAIENLNTADTREKQDEIISTLDAAMNRVNGDAYAFENLSENYVVITERARGGLKVDFEQNPQKTLEAMKKDYPALAKLSEPQLQYLATSKFVAREFTKLLRDNPQEFVDKACERAALISKAASKNGTFVEVNFCEQWTDKPFFEKGTLCSPKIADKTVTGCEAQARGFSAEAEKRGDYFPYTKCDLTIFTPNKDGKLISLNTRVDIGDGAQTSLKDHLEQLCKRGSERKEVLANFTEALTERADKRKLLVQDLSAKPQSAEQPEMTTEKEGNMSREEWDGQIKDAREKAAQEQREKAAEKAQNKSNRDRAE